MKIETAIQMIMAELERAETLHPWYPRDAVKAISLLSEEAGEAVRAANSYDETRTGKKEIVTEVIHTAASAFRFLKNYEPEEKSYE